MNKIKRIIKYVFQYLFFILQKFFTKKVNQNKDILIVGNGPSFKDSIEKRNLLFNGKDILVVNNFLLTKYFQELKPKYYLIADPAFFIDIEKEKGSGENFILNKKRIKDIQTNFINGLLNKVNRDMNLLIPLHMDIKEFSKKIEENKHIKIKRYIMNPINIRFSGIRNFLYKYNFGMPTAQNVLIAAIYVALNMNYKNIYLVGGDHSWFEDYYIDENNVLYSRDKHFYENKQKMVPLMNNGKPSKIHEELYFLYKAFKGHVLLESYSKYLGSHIINASKKSYIDAYDRLK